jgi:hypothetical protein
MVSTLKVNTIKKQSGSSITIGESGDSIVNNALDVTPQGTSANPITFTVTVAAKTSANVYNGAGSSNAYFINGTEAPSFFIEGNESSSYEYYYKFDQSDASNGTGGGHPLRFYLDAARTQIFSTNVTTNGTPGQAGAYTQIKVGGYTPNVLYYQCSNHAFMGNKLINPATKTLSLSGAAITLPTGTGNPNQFIGYSSSSAGVTATTWSTVIGETKPTITGISPNVAENTQTAITITGTNFVNTPYVDAINSTGAITSADSVSFTSATTLVTNFTLPVDGTYFIRVENPDGNAVRSGTAILTVSDAPAWQTAAGSLGSVDAGGTISFTVNATNATAYAVQSGSLPGGASLNTSTGAITGTESGATQDTTYNFTIRATDAQAQTADRAFSIAVNVGISNAMRFDS